MKSKYCVFPLFKRRAVMSVRINDKTFIKNLSLKNISCLSTHHE